MLTDPPLKDGYVISVRKNRLGKGIPDTGYGWDKGFSMPRYALVRQPHTITVRRGCLTSITGTRKRRGYDGPKFNRTVTKIDSIKNGERGHSATKRERIKGGSQTSIVDRVESLSLHPIKDASEWRTTPNMRAILQTRSNESHV